MQSPVGDGGSPSYQPAITASPAESEKVELSKHGHFKLEPCIPSRIGKDKKHYGYTLRKKHPPRWYPKISFQVSPSADTVTADAGGRQQRLCDENDMCLFQVKA